MLAAGVSNVVVGVGDHELVARYIEAKYGLDEHVYAVHSEVQLGNGGDLLQAVQKFPHLFTENVAIANVDTILDWSVGSVLAPHTSNSAACTIALTLKKGVPNEGAFYVDATDRVIYSAEARSNILPVEVADDNANYRGSSTGSVILSTEFLKSIKWTPNDGSYSLYKDIVGGALATEGLYAYNNEDRYFIDVGTVPTWEHITRHPEVLKPYLHY